MPLELTAFRPGMPECLYQNRGDNGFAYPAFALLQKMNCCHVFSLKNTFWVNCSWVLHRFRPRLDDAGLALGMDWNG
jgi:hypothetical protein